MNPSDKEEPHTVGTSCGGQVNQLKSDKITSDDDDEKLNQEPSEITSLGTTLRKRNNVKPDFVGDETKAMIPLKSEDIERAIVRKDDEVKLQSGKPVSQQEADVTESTKISTIDEDHPKQATEAEKGIRYHQCSAEKYIEVKTKIKCPTDIEIVSENDGDDDEPSSRGPCGNKWKEHHFEFELDVSALHERAAEQAERIAEHANKVAEQAGRYVGKVKEAAWRVMPHNVLPEWLKDNDFLHYHHRPPMPSFKSCFRSIFRIHTETGNIWTHLLGCFLFIALMIYFLVTSIMGRDSWQKIIVYMAFFLGAIICLGFSCFFHTCSCHSVRVAAVCSKMDYSGITLLIVGSFVPWLYFGFYCEVVARSVYSAFIVVLGTVCLVVAMKDTFGQPKYRPFRAALFISLGLSAVIPGVHYVIKNSFLHAIEAGAFGWMILMGAMYIGGAMLYALRIPERFFPGKCDIWFQSHQFFHVLVVTAAMVHFHGLNLMAAYREEAGECPIETVE